MFRVVCRSFVSVFCRCGAMRCPRNERRVRVAPSTRIAAMRAGDSRFALICGRVSTRFGDREEKIQTRLER